MKTHVAQAQTRPQEARPLPTLVGHVAEYERDIERILITEEEIQDMVRALGDRITEDYRDRPPLLIGVLKGAFVLMADLSRIFFI